MRRKQEPRDYRQPKMLLPCPRCVQGVVAHWEQRPGYAKNDVWVFPRHRGCPLQVTEYREWKVNTFGLHPGILSPDWRTRERYWTWKIRVRMTVERYKLRAEVAGAAGDEK